MMNDIFHYYGSDISHSATGDLLPVSGDDRGKQRILRRLLTNPGDYIWNTSYGAGLPGKVGNVLDVAAIRSLISGQILLEPSVAKIPAPTVDVSEIPGGINVVIRYSDSVSKAPQILNFDVSK